MTICHQCGVDNPPKKQFCRKCGQILDKNHKPVSGTQDIFDAAFGGEAIKKTETARQTQPSQAGPGPQPASQNGTPNSMTGQSRAQILKMIARTGSKAIFKSLSLSALVLGPGFALLFMGQTLPGMIWLFFGSFGLMAWSYRKPWRLGLIACLIPPLAAGLAYLVQLWLFGEVMPPGGILILAVSMGLLAGYVRARSHQVKTSEDGSIIAERTIGYLLIWVAAYGITQAFAYFSINSLAVRAGLVTGAFSTAMLVMVSVIIWRQFRTLKSSSITVILMALVAINLFSPTPANAAPQACRQISGSWSTLVNIPMISGYVPAFENRYNQQYEKGCSLYQKFWPSPDAARDEVVIGVVVDQRKNSPTASEISRQAARGEFDRNIGDVGGVFIPEHSIGQKRLILVFWKGPLQFSLSINATDSKHSPRRFSEAEVRSSMIALYRKIFQLAAVPRSRPAPTAKPPEQPAATSGVSAQCTATRLSCQASSGDTCAVLACREREYEACAATIHPVAVDALAAQIQYLRGQIKQNNLSCSAASQTSESRAEPSSTPVTEATQICFTAQGKVLLLSGSDPMELAKRCASGPTSCRDMRAQSYPNSVECPWVTDPQPGSSQNSTEQSDGTGGDQGGGPALPQLPSNPLANPLDGDPTSEEKQEAIIATTAAITAALIAAGIAANVAQAVAAAVAQALQAGVQLTSEELQSVIADALLRRTGNSGTETGDPPENNAPPNSPQSERFRPPTPVYDENGRPYETNDKGEYLVPDRQGGFEPMSKKEAERASAADREEKRNRAAASRRHRAEAQREMDESNARRQQGYRATEAEEQRTREARHMRRTVEETGERRGEHGIADRASSDNMYNEDGSINTEYLEKLRRSLRNRIGRDQATGDPDYDDNSITRILRETASASADDASNSMIARGALGMASGGASEGFFQGRQVWNAVRAAAEKAEDEGKTLSRTDALRIVAREAANENLPVNTAQALDRIRKGEKVSWGELAMSLAADGISLADLGEAGERLTGIKPGDAAANLARRTLSEEAFDRTASAIRDGKARVNAPINRAVSAIQDADARATNAINRATGGRLEATGFGTGDRLTSAQANVRYENGDLDGKTGALIDDVKAEGNTGDLDNGFQEGRARGEQRVNDFERSMRELEELRASGKATPEQMAAAQRKMRDDLLRIQGDKHAMNQLNSRNKGGDGSGTIVSFNGELDRIHGETDARMIQRLAEEYGVRPEDIQVVTISNVKGEGGGIVNPGAPERSAPGHASKWTEDGRIENSRAARSEPGTIDGPETGRLPEAGTKLPSDKKAGMDRDLTMRVRTIENGKVVYRDIPSTTTARIYNEEFFETATGKKVPNKGAPLPPADGGSPKQGNSVDFKDTHLDESGHIGDVTDIDDPQVFARRMDQATTDRLHPEAYGTGQGDLNSATKDSFRGRDLTDAGGTAATVEFKVDHWMNESHRLQEMAKLPENAAVRGQLLEQAAANMEEAQRQLVKQHGNMVLKRTNAMQLLSNAPGARIPAQLAERVNVLKQVQMGKLSPAQAEATLRKMGSSTKDLSRQMSAYIEGLQTLRPPRPPKGPSVVLQGWKDEFRNDKSASQGG